MLPLCLWSYGAGVCYGRDRASGLRRATQKRSAGKVLRRLPGAFCSAFARYHLPITPCLIQRVTIRRARYYEDASVPRRAPCDVQRFTPVARAH